MKNLISTEEWHLRNISPEAYAIVEQLDRELTAKIEHCQRVEDDLTAANNRIAELELDQNA